MVARWSVYRKTELRNQMFLPWMIFGLKFTTAKIYANKFLIQTTLIGVPSGSLKCSYKDHINEYGSDDNLNNLRKKRR
jgi:hypothetical protein